MRIWKSLSFCAYTYPYSDSVKIKRAPNILALHLKRFKYIWNDNGVFMRKLSYRINFGSQLKLFNMSEDSETPDRLYELIAVLVHIGG